MAKIDPGLKYLAAGTPDDWRGLAARARFGLDVAGAVETANVMVELESSEADVPAALLAANFVPRTRAGAVLTGDFPLARIRELETVPGLKRAEASRGLRHELDLALPEARVTAVHEEVPEHRGTGVIVGIIDHGIDFRHKAFRNGDGSTRILAIWDQNLTPRPGTLERAPAGLRYGVEYTRDDIDNALTSKNPNPKAVVAHEDEPPFHGTHVAGIAAGNGEPSDVFPPEPARPGVAPRADLIVVANTRGKRRDPGTLGDSADTLDAASYILKVARALDRPVAINLSQGDNIGPHDGTSLLEAGLASLLAGPKCALIKSAGNEGASCRHAQGVLSAGGTSDVGVVVSGEVAEIIVDIWYPAAGSLGLRITAPDGSTAATRFAPPSENLVRLSNGNEVFVDADIDDPGNGDSRTFVVLRAKGSGRVLTGTWTFHLDGKGPWHAWIQRDSSAAFAAADASPASTLSIPGTVDAVISVGCYVSDRRFSTDVTGARSQTSSLGPTRDGRPAPTLSAPGQQITAAQPGDHVVAFRGTSMAAPMVTGAVALMFQARPSSTAAEIRCCLQQSAQPADRHTGPLPNDEWGAGKLDVAAAIQRLRALP